MKRGYKLFIKDVLSAMESIERFVEGMEIIGEAARNVPDWIREKYPHIPWESMVGMRNLSKLDDNGDESYESA